MSGVFGLKKAYNRQRVDNWPESSNYGYYTGGTYPSATYKSDIQRIDFFNETVSVPGNLPGNRKNAGGVFNSNYGYLGAGQNPQGRLATIARIDFSNETTSDVSNNLPQERAALTAVSSLDYGYFGGGTKPPLSPPWQATIDRIDFSNETTSAPGNNLTEERANLAGVFTSDSGYFAGGNPPPVYVQTSIIDRIDFTSETVVGPPIHGIYLTQTRQSLKGVSSSNYGYFAGGYDGETTPATVATIDRIDFSTEVVSAPGNNLPEQRSNACGVFNLNYGYFAGGQESPPTLYSALVSRIDFSTEVLSTPGNNLPQGRSMQQTVSGGTKINAKGLKKYRTDKIGNPISKKNAYFAGGWNPSAPDASLVVDRMDYSSETVTDLTEGALPVKTSYLRSVVSENNYGYSAGGYSPSVPNRTNVVSRIDFSNETQSLPGKDLSVNRDVWASTYNNNYGYFVAGNTLPSATTVNTVDRIDFSNEVLSSPSIGQLPQKMFNGPTGIIFTSYCGYFAGGRPTGFTNANQCVTYRLDFTTETFGNLSTGDVMSVKRDRLSSHASSDYGYLVGGDEPTVLSTIDRLDFSNEVLTLYPTAILPSPGRMLFAATGNKSYAYYAGGWHGIDDIDRMDYSTETVGDIPSSLSQGRYGLTGLS